MGTGKAGLLFAAGVLVGFALSFTLGSPRGASPEPSSPKAGQAVSAPPRLEADPARSPEAKRVAELEGELEKQRAALKKAEDARDAAQKELAQASEAGAGKPAPREKSPSPEPAHASLDAAALAAKLRRIDVEGETAIHGKDWKGALSLLKELRKLSPDAGEAAWPSVTKLASELWKASNANQLQGGTASSFWRLVGSEEFAPLYAKAITTPDGYEAGFRTLAVDAFGFSGFEGAQDLLLARLPAETDQQVALSMATALGQSALGKENVDQILAGLRAQQGTQVRQYLVQVLAGIDGPEATHALAQVAQTDPDQTVKDQAQTAAAARTAPVMGYMISDVVPGSQAEAAGLKKGDILVAYNGAALSNYAELMQAKKTVADGTPVTVTIYRSGAMLQVALKGGQIGINGQFVYPPAENR